MISETSNLEALKEQQSAIRSLDDVDAFVGALNAVSRETAKGTSTAKSRAQAQYLESSAFLVFAGLIPCVVGLWLFYIGAMGFQELF